MVVMAARVMVARIHVSTRIRPRTWRVLAHDAAQRSPPASDAPTADEEIGEAAAGRNAQYSNRCRAELDVAGRYICRTRAPFLERADVGEWRRAEPRQYRPDSRVATATEMNDRSAPPPPGGQDAISSFSFSDSADSIASQPMISLASFLAQRAAASDEPIGKPMIGGRAR